MKLIDREVVLSALKRLAADVCSGMEISAIDVLSEINDVVLEAPIIATRNDLTNSDE